MSDTGTQADTKNPDQIEKNERQTPDFWRRWLRAAERAAEKHWQRARAAWREYEDANKELRYPIYNASCKTLEPALYARTPKITTRRRFDIKDDTALTASLIAERLGEYLIDCVEFDEIFHAEVQDFIHAGKAAPQVVYEHDAQEVEERVPLLEQGGIYVDGAGAEWTEEVLQDDTGFFGRRLSTTPTSPRIRVVALPFDEVLHTPDAKSHAEIREMAYYFCLNKDEAEARFGEKAKGISWKSKKQAAKGGAQESVHERDRVESIGDYVEGWEIWSKPEREVYWFSEQYHDGFLDQKEDRTG